MNRKLTIDDIFAAVVVLLLSICFLITVVHRTAKVSEKENRELAGRPKFSIGRILSGEYMDDFETYAADQFIWRDGAISLKADFEHFLGKNDNNGVYFCKDDYLITKPAEYARKTVDNNLNALSVIKNAGAYNMTVAVVPTAYEVMSDKLPKHSHDGRMTAVTAEVNSVLGGSGIAVCDTTAALKAHSGEYIYYRTDHHQTALGSYYVYAELGGYLGYTPYQQGDFIKDTLSDSFFGTSWSKASIGSIKPDVIDRYALPGIETSVEFPLEGKSMIGMYSADKLEKKDKYSVYLDGNHGLTVIHSNCGSGRSIALMKDSYAHSLAPFLANHFDNIYMIDMRYYNDDFVRYLGELGIKDILVLYNADTFNTDTNLIRAASIAETTDYYAMPPFGVVAESEPVGDEYFTDAVFIGDSISVGHSMYSSLPAAFICKTAVNTRTMHTAVQDNGMTMYQEIMNSGPYNKYYLMFGINEVSYTSTNDFISAYRAIIEDIRSLNTDAVIYIESLLPVERSAEARGIYADKIREYNNALMLLAEEAGCYYLDISSVIAEPDGYLRDGAASDGVHVGKAEHDKWDDFLRTHAILTKQEGSALKTFSLYTGGGNIDVDAFAQDMLNSISFKDNMSPVRENVAARMYSLNEGDVLNGVVYCGGGSTAEEFALFEAADSAKAEEIGNKLRERVEHRKSDFKTYKPEEMPKLNNPVIIVDGNVAMLCISDDNDAARAVMNKIPSVFTFTAPASR